MNCEGIWKDKDKYEPPLYNGCPGSYFPVVSYNNPTKRRIRLFIKKSSE